MMARHLPTPELRAALADLLGLENLDDIRSIKINFTGHNAVTVDVEMFVWDQNRLTSALRQRSRNNDHVGITPAMAEALKRERQADQS